MRINWPGNFLISRANNVSVDDTRRTIVMRDAGQKEYTLVSVSTYIDLNYLNLHIAFQKAAHRNESGDNEQTEITFFIKIESAHNVGRINQLFGTPINIITLGFSIMNNV